MHSPARFLGEPETSGSIRSRVEDFQVTELPLVEPVGEGMHLWLEIEKREANTHWVAERLAAAAGIHPRDVGYAGLKDRRAVTTQWFSVALQEASSPDWESWQIPDASILQARLHSRKLKRGALRGNRFRIVVRELTGDPEGLEERLQSVATDGVPNYFGSQRFGHGGRNVERGVRWLEYGGRLPRNKRSIYLSAVRSELFNRVLSARVERENWNRIVDGDVALLDGSRSMFPCQMPDPELEQRCAGLDIHPTGPLPGSDGRLLAERTALEIETTALAGQQVAVAGLASAGLEAARRSLRLYPTEFEWAWEGPDLVLSFGLPAGGYATSVLRELVSVNEATISEES
jgi:tRNA pseudouridine13 synthase